MPYKINVLPLFLLIPLVSNNVFSQGNQTDNPAYKNGTTTDNADIKVKPLRAVEVGAGGNIKLERTYRTNIESQHEWHAHLLWESRYVTEGRDNLPGNSISSVSTELNYNELTIVPWIANSISSDYTEFNLNIVYGTRLTKTIMRYTGYNYIHANAN